MLGKNTQDPLHHVLCLGLVGFLPQQRGIRKGTEQRGRSRARTWKESSVYLLKSLQGRFLPTGCLWASHYRLSGPAFPAAHTEFCPVPNLCPWSAGPDLPDPVHPTLLCPTCAPAHNCEALSTFSPFSLLSVFKALLLCPVGFLDPEPPKPSAHCPGLPRPACPAFPCVEGPEWSVSASEGS